MVYGFGLNGFQGTEVFFYKMNRVGGGGHLGAHQEGGTSPSVLLNASYHKKGRI